MNNRTPILLLAILAVFGTLTISSAYAQNAEDEQEETQILMIDTIISIDLDKTEYVQGDIIQAHGKVANISPGGEVTIKIINPLNSIVSLAQIGVESDGTYETSFNTAGKLWKHSGIYIIEAYYGSEEKKDSIRIVLTSSDDYMEEEKMELLSQCSEEEILIVSECMTGSISGATIEDSLVNKGDNSIVININAEDNGMLELTMPEEIQSGIFSVWVDGEESNDVTIDGDTITVEFHAGAEMIEIFGTYVIPEFGAIAAMILAVAIVATIVVSARSRLSIIPRY